MDLFDTIAHEVNEKVTQLKDDLAKGNKDPEGYKFICGEIKGLLFVKQYVIDLKQQLENSDNE